GRFPDIAVDSSGSAYVTGVAAQGYPSTPGAFEESRRQIFVTKLNPAGSALVYSTFLGGTGPGDDISQAVGVGGSGSAYLTGSTEDRSFPTTPGAYDTTFNETRSIEDVFVTKLSPDGSQLVYSTFIGGTGEPDQAFGIAVQ